MVTSACLLQEKRSCVAHCSCRSALHKSQNQTLAGDYVWSAQRAANALEPVHRDGLLLALLGCAGVDAVLFAVLCDHCCLMGVTADVRTSVLWPTLRWFAFLAMCSQSRPSGFLRSGNLAIGEAAVAEGVCSLRSSLKCTICTTAWGGHLPAGLFEVLGLVAALRITGRSLPSSFTSPGSWQRPPRQTGPQSGVPPLPVLPVPLQIAILWISMLPLRQSLLFPSMRTNSHYGDQSIPKPLPLTKHCIVEEVTGKYHASKQAAVGHPCSLP